MCVLQGQFVQRQIEKMDKDGLSEENAFQSTWNEMRSDIERSYVRPYYEHTMKIYEDGVRTQEKELVDAARSAAAVRTCTLQEN